MTMSPVQESLIMVLILLVATIAGVVYIALPEEPPWPIYVYTIVSAIGTLYFGVKAFRLFGG